MIEKVRDDVTHFFNHYSPLFSAAPLRYNFWMRYNGLRFTNGLLLALVLILTLTGLYGLFWTTSALVFDLHRVSAWALLALLPWKAVIVVRSLRRKLHGTRHPTWLVISLSLAALILISLALGLFWKGRFGPLDYPLRQTAISWHWMLSLGLLLPFLLHVWQRWPRPRRVDFLSRRGLLRAAVVAPLAALGYLGSQRIAGLRMHPQEPTRFTGSRQAAVVSGNTFPLTHNTAPSAEQIDPATWRLAITGAIPRPLQLGYTQIADFPSAEQPATIDCTLGWYAQQTWRGVRLADLLQQAGLDHTPTAVQLISVTGYQHTLPWDEAAQILLATHVGGEVLSDGHGFPLRAVVPTRRGWFWVKWLGEIKVLG